MSIIIIGGGIIGFSTAYYLIELGHDPTSIHVVEDSDEFFCGASGYAGGFLASDWYSPVMLPLGHLSFRLHRELAEKYDGHNRWGYSGSTALSLDLTTSDHDSSAVSISAADWLLQGTSRSQVAARNAKSDTFQHHRMPMWLRGDIDKTEILSTASSTAQVDPLRLCQFLLETCRLRGVQIHLSCSVINVTRHDESKRLRGVNLSDGTEVQCTRIAITSGPWSAQILKDLFPRSCKNLRKIQVGSLAGHSIVVRSPHWRADVCTPLECHALFATPFTTSKAIIGCHRFAPEVFSRPANEIYIAGLNSSEAPLPKRAQDRKLDPDAIAALNEVAVNLIRSNAMNPEIEVVREGYCFRPTTKSGRTYIAKIANVDVAESILLDENEGVFLSAGAGPWGISLSQGIGRVFAELILGRSPSIDLTPYDVN